MALWGNKDSKTASGTIEIAANGNVTGTSTAFTTEAKDGDYIRVSGEDYLITAISSNTAAVVTAGVPGATLTARSAGSAYTLSEKPEFVTSSESTSTNGVHGDPTKVYGVDANEAEETPAVTHAGWVRRTTGSGGRSGRVFYETLVASGSITGDQADDTLFPDTTITISAQPVNRTGLSDPATTTFSVTATATQGVTPTYQWQEDTGGGFSNITNGGVYSDATTATLTLTGIDKATYDGYAYRCVVSATGAAADVNSSSATLTFA